jgi:YqfQ-like protein
MFQGRPQGQGPNFLAPNRPFMQQQQPNFQRRPQENRGFLQQMPMQPQMGRQSRANGPFQQQPKKEGLLGKLLGKSKQTPQNLFAPPSGIKQETRSGGGILETLKSPQGLNTMLNNTQRVLQAAEQFTPMIQQYGPIVKNIPSMWKIMRAFSSSDTEKEETKKEETVKKTTTKKKQEISSSAPEEKPKQRVRKKKSESVPKLYI